MFPSDLPGTGLRGGWPPTGDHHRKGSLRDGEYVLEAIARENPDRYPTQVIREAVLNDYQRARVRYLQVVDQARGHWGDG